MWNLYPSAYWVDKLTDFYYECLNGDARFQEALKALFQELAGPWETMESLCPPWRSANVDAERWPYHPTGIDDPCRQAYDAVATRLSDFCQQWHLPREHGMEDLAHAFRLWRLAQGRPPRLIRGIRTFLEPQIGFPVTVGVQEEEDITIRIVDYVPIIFPNIPLPFVYDPVECSQEQLQERIETICQEIRQSILAQAEEYKRQAGEAGFKPRPPRLTPKQMERVARAIYRRAVCRWKWDDIRQEYKTDDEPVYDAQRFADRIRNWAKACGIPLG